MTITCPYCFEENNNEATRCHSCGGKLPVTSPVTLVNSYHLPPGSLLQQGRYKIKKVLGEGGFGITYKGIDQQQSIPIAIKELRPENAARQGTTVVWSSSITPKEKQYQITKFKLEASNQQKCDHPNIAKIYDWFDENNTAYIAMEFIQGKSLLDILEEEGALPEARVKKYMTQVTNALVVVHRHNFLHRDIKPENILIDPRDRAILIDFGAAREFIAGKTREMTQILSVGYAPIEQYSKKSKRFPATDIYALCASIYELLTGELPAPATERALDDHLIPPRQLAPHLDPKLEKIILKGMNIRVNERFQTAAELLQMLSEGEQKTLSTSIECSVCFAENTRDVKYCTSCGSLLFIECSVCSAKNSRDAEYCTSCASSLPLKPVIPFHLSAGTPLKQGRYRIDKVLGEGWFSITYKGIDQQQSLPVAIKELRPDEAQRQGTKIIWLPSVSPKEKQYQIQRCEKTARNQRKCIHPNIPKLYDCFEENNTIYIVMDFIPGKSLLNVLEEEGVLSESRVVKYTIQVANALKIVHANRILHRDIKPHSILIDPKDEAVLISFDIAEGFVPGQTSEMRQVLSMGYSPIEQYSKRAKRVAATDIYALCASMYELLTGKLPDSATDRAISDPLISPRQLRPEISEAIEKVILKGLKMKVEERFQTADELIEALDPTKKIRQSLGIKTGVAKLIPVRPQGSTTEFILEKDRLTVGRYEPGETPVDINLDNFYGANTVSRQHAGIYQEGGQWNVQDLGSYNGTFIKPVGQRNFYKLTASTSLNSGDEISFGKIRLRFEID